MFNIRKPKDSNFSIETKGLTMGKDAYEWKNIKSFNIKESEEDSFSKLLIETKNHFLPIYTIPLPKGMDDKVKENLLRVLPRSEINEPKLIIFAEKIGL
jgi:hypothetical protein